MKNQRALFAFAIKILLKEYIIINEYNNNEGILNRVNLFFLFSLNLTKKKTQTN